MNVLQNLSIKTRLGIGYVVITGALILVAIMGLHGEAKTQESLDNQVNHLNVVKSLGNQVLDAANARAISARNLMIAGSKEDAAAELRLIGAAHDSMGLALKSVEQGPPDRPARNSAPAQPAGPDQGDGSRLWADRAGDHAAGQPGREGRSDPEDQHGMPPPADQAGGQHRHISGRE